jgi:nucleoside-diphosphate-sugar epimerase
VSGSLFVTGASGFIGQNLLSRLNPQRYDRIYCLTRSESPNLKTIGQKNITWLRGSLFDSDSYEHCLDSSVVVVHLAAATGMAPVEQYFSVNCEGTRHLVARCRQRQVNNFLYVSSIAANYRDKSHYHYAQSKLEGENVVKKSGLRYAIVRPTIVLGKESPGWRALSRLARLRWVPVFGDGTARIQPIAVEDLVDAMMSIIDEEEFHDESFDLGGSEALSIEEFLKKAHRFYCGDEPRVVHLPYQPVKQLLSLAEAYFSSMLPLNVGQLSVFVQDGTIRSNRLYEKQRPSMRDLNSVLRFLIQ